MRWGDNVKKLGMLLLVTLLSVDFTPIITITKAIDGEDAVEVADNPRLTETTQDELEEGSLEKLIKDNSGLERNELEDLIKEELKQDMESIMEEYTDARDEPLIRTMGELSVNAIGETKSVPNPESDFLYENTGASVAITGYIGKSTEVTIPDTLAGRKVVNIKAKAFQGKNLTKLNLQLVTGLSYIGDNSFSDNKIEELIIPEGVGSILRQAFKNNQLKRVIIPSSVTRIDVGVFEGNQEDSRKLTIVGGQGSKSMEYADLNAHTFEIDESLDYGVTLLSDGTLEVSNYRGANMEVSIPKEMKGKRVTIIGKNAFSRKRLTRLELPEGLVRIEEGAFMSQGITDIKIPNTVKYIGDSAFTGGKLETLILGSGVTSIGKGSFQNNKLTRVDIPNNVETIGGSAFSMNAIVHYTLPEGMTKIPDGIFGFNKIEEVEIPDTIESVGGSSFMGNTITSLKLGKGVKDIGELAFGGNKLNNIMLPDNVKYLGNMAFYGNSLEHVDLGKGLLTIGDMAFYINTLKEIRIPRSVTSMGTDVFLQNQAVSTDLTILGYKGSLTETYARNNNHTYKSADEVPPTVNFTTDGNSVYKTSASTVVNVKDNDSGVAKMRYQWTTSTTFPTTGTWAGFTDGQTLALSNKTGDYYIHIEAEDNEGNITKKTSKVFKLDSTLPSIVVSKGTSEWTNDRIVITARVKDEHSGLKGLTLPNGAVSTYSDDKESTTFYEATENGIYRFTIEDKAGNKQTAEVTVANIDKINPTISIDYTPKGWTKDNVQITATGEDTLSGIKNVRLETEQNSKNVVSLKDLQGFDIGNVKQEGTGIQYTSNGDAMYEGLYMSSKLLSANEWYVMSFDITKKSGSIPFIGGHAQLASESKVYIDGKIIDTQSTSNSWTTVLPYPNDAKKHHVKVVMYTGNYATASNKNLYIQPNRGAVGYPYEVLIENVQLEKGKEETPYEPNYKDVLTNTNPFKVNVSGNGKYTFIATDKAGNETTQAINITSIDKTPPKVTIEGNPKEYTQLDSINLTIKATDTQSGVKSITLPDNKEVNGSTATYKVTKNGDYTFIVTDNVGNTTTVTETVDKLMVNYTFYLNDSKGKPLKGAGFDLMRDGIKYGYAESDDTGLVNFGKVPPTGKYTIKQVKAPDGYVVNPDEKDVEVGDTTEPEEFISYPRGTVLPATGTMGRELTYAVAIGVSLVIVMVNDRRRKVSKTK